MLLGDSFAALAVQTPSPLPKVWYWEGNPTPQTSEKARRQDTAFWPDKRGARAPSLMIMYAPEAVFDMKETLAL
ncbi:unnamed protein product [Boreogadus saida]